MGRGYVIEHCVSTLNAIRQEENYRIYITDVLKMIAQGVGYKVKFRYADFLKKAKDNQKDDGRTSEDIINAIKAKAELINNGPNEFSGESHA